MIEQILIPTSTDIIVHIPDEYLGKRVRVRVDEDENAALVISDEELVMRRSFLNAHFSQYPIDTLKFRFNRDEANDYE